MDNPHQDIFNHRLQPGLENKQSIHHDQSTHDAYGSRLLRQENMQIPPQEVLRKPQTVWAVTESGLTETTTPHPNLHQRSVGNQQESPVSGLLDAFVNTCQRWNLGPDEQMILLGYEPDDIIGKCVLSGRINPTSQDFKDRVSYIVGISLGLGTLFAEMTAAEVNWLKQPRTRLNGQSSFDHMLEGHISNLLVIADMVARERGL